MVAYAKRVILHAPPWGDPALAAFVGRCVRDGVVLVAVVGPDCQRVEDVLDELLVGDATQAGRGFTTTSHPDEPLAEVRRFVAAWTLGADPREPVQEVWLAG